MAGSFGEPETLVCEPYLIEPSLTQIVNPRNLTGRMRLLAAALSIPECGYAGRFALHCAAATAGRAREWPGPVSPPERPPT